MRKSYTVPFTSTNAESCKLHNLFPRVQISVRYSPGYLILCINSAGTETGNSHCYHNRSPPLELLPHCGDMQIYVILSPEYKYLCVNSVPYHLRPPLRGHANYIILSPRYIDLCVNGTPYHLRPPLREL